MGEGVLDKGCSLGEGLWALGFAGAGGGALTAEAFVLSAFGVILRAIGGCGAGFSAEFAVCAVGEALVCGGCADIAIFVFFAAIAGFGERDALAFNADFFAGATSDTHAGISTKVALWIANFRAIDFIGRAEEALWTIIGAFAACEAAGAIFDALVFVHAEVVGAATFIVIAARGAEGFFALSATFVGGGIAATEVANGVDAGAIIIGFADDRCAAKVVFTDGFLGIGAIVIDAALDLAAGFFAASLACRAIVVFEAGDTFLGAAVTAGFLVVCARGIRDTRGFAAALFVADRSACTIGIRAAGQHTDIAFLSDAFRDTLRAHTTIGVLDAILFLKGFATSVCANLVVFAIISAGASRSTAFAGVTSGLGNTLVFGGGIARFAADISACAIGICCAGIGRSRASRKSHQKNKGTYIQTNTHSFSPKRRGV